MPVKVSVIVPIFGVEKYMERCARSLFSQTMTDVEFIFVNDCTQDSSMVVLERIIGEYPNRQVQIINHERNHGLPMARKTGLNAAGGDYIIHCDSDDWVEPDYCRKMYEAAISQNADIVVCGYSLNDGINPSEDKGYDDSLLSDSAQAVRSAISLKSSPFVWNKMVRRSLYETAGIRFPEKFLAEDWALTVQLVMAANRIYYIGDRLYNYFVNPTSILRQPTKEICIKKITDEAANVQLVDDLLKQRGLDVNYKSEMVKRKAITKSMVFPCTSDKECRHIWRNIFREANWQILFNKDVDRYYKRKHLMLLLGLYAPLRRLYHIVKPG